MKKVKVVLELGKVGFGLFTITRPTFSEFKIDFIKGLELEVELGR